MRLKHNLRHELGIVTSQAQALWAAMQALPDEVDTMHAALEQLSATERQQLAAYLRLVGQRCGQMAERCRWLHVHLTQGIGSGGV